MVSWPPGCMPWYRTGFRLARAAYMAAVYPAGPDPMISTCTCSCEVLFSMLLINVLVLVLILFWNNNGPVCYAVASPVSQRSLYIAQYARGRCKGVAGGGIGEIRRAPEIIGIMIYVAEFQRYGIPFVK